MLCISVLIHSYGVLLEAWGWFIPGKCWIGTFTTGTAWASISGGGGGARGMLTTPRPEGVSIGNVLILFQFIKQIYRHIY